LVLSWWAYGEATFGTLDRAVELAHQALQCADRDSEKVLETQLATWLLVLGRFDDAAKHARNALALALDSQHEQLIAMGIAYCAASQADRDATGAATAFGYANARLTQLGWEHESDDKEEFAKASLAISSRMRADEFASLVERGATLSQDDALRLLTPALALGRERHDAAVDSRYAVRTLLI